MTVEQVIVAITGFLTTVLCSYIAIKIKKFYKRSERNTELRQEEAYLNSNTINAIYSVLRVFIHAYRGETPNGDLEKAEQYLESSKHEQEEFQRKMAARIRK